MKEYQDFYFRKAKTEHYPARSVYKLKEIDQKFKILRHKMRVLDLGASPGSWSMGAAEKIGPQGLVVACDLIPCGCSLPENVRFFQTNALDPSGEFADALAGYGPFDVVMSDMAPKTTGSRVTDQSRSLELAQSALDTALMWLKPLGSFVVKVFMGPEVGELASSMRKGFQRVHTFKPKSSRSESFETFLVGLRRKPQAG